MSWFEWKGSVGILDLEGKSKERGKSMKIMADHYFEWHDLDHRYPLAVVNISINSLFHFVTPKVIITNHLLFGYPFTQILHWDCVAGVGVCLLLLDQRNSVGIINGKKGGVGNVGRRWGLIWVERSQEGRVIRGNGRVVRHAEFLKIIEETD